MTTLYHYKIYCNTDSQYEFVWAEDPPTVCPMNNTHSVNTDSIAIDDQVANNIVKIKEESVPTGENFMAECHSIDYATGPNVSTSKDFIWPHPINTMGIVLSSTEENIGDEISLCVAPNTIIGAIGMDAGTGATGSVVSSTVTDNAMVGYHLCLTDGVELHNCGRVTAINSELSTIHWEYPLTFGFSASSPTYVTMTVYVINNYTIGPPQTYMIGQTKIGGSYIPANIIVRATVTNKEAYAKKITAQVEFLY